MFSFLKLTEAQGSAYDQELRGVFLRKLPAREPAEEVGDSTLKLLVDGYSRLGAFVGLAAEFPPAASFMGGIGFSRSIYQDPSTGLYTPYYPYVPGTETDWNESVLLGMPVRSLRFGAMPDPVRQRSGSRAGDPGSDFGRSGVPARSTRIGSGDHRGDETAGDREGPTLETRRVKNIDPQRPMPERPFRGYASGLLDNKMVGSGRTAVPVEPRRAGPRSPSRGAARLGAWPDSTS
jgi:hypothetical protein